METRNKSKKLYKANKFSFHILHKSIKILLYVVRLGFVKIFNAKTRNTNARLARLII